MKSTIIKTLLVGLFLSAAASSAFAQGGTVAFDTFNETNTALGKVFLWDGASPPGSGYLGQLWWSDTTHSVFTPVGTPQPFSETAPNYVQDGLVAIPFHDAGVAVFFEMRVWNAAAGADWNTAINNPLLIAYGITQAKSRVLGGIDSDGNIFATQQFNNFPNMTLGPYPLDDYFPRFTATRAGTNLILNWSGPHFLQSATNVAGVYTNVTANSPYTNGMTSYMQQFFRLY